MSTTETLMTQPSEQANSQGGAAASTGATDTKAADTSTSDAGAAGAQGQQAAAGGDQGKGDEPGAGKTEGDAGKKDGDKPAGAPEKYEFKAPEGATLDDTVSAAFSEVAKELNLPQDAAQKVIDKVAPVMAQRQAEAIAAARQEWATASTSDKEFGGEKLQENLGVAKKAMDTFGTPELRALLNGTGLGNHPEVIRFMYRAGKAIGEDGIVNGGRNGGTETDPAKRMFPSMN